MKYNKKRYFISHTTTHSTIEELCSCSITLGCSSDPLAVDADVVLLILAYFSSREVRTLEDVFPPLQDKWTPLSSSSRFMISLKSASKLSGVWKKNLPLVSFKTWYSCKSWIYVCHSRATFFHNTECKFIKAPWVYLKDTCIWWGKNLHQLKGVH